MNSYEINEDTLAIIPKTKDKSIVHEKYRTYVINKSVDKIMEESCEYYGSSFKGRQQGSEKILNLTHKIPIIVEETNELIFFPTASPRINKCSWINLNNIKRYERNDIGCKIIFNSGKEVILPISYGIINNQILRSSRLLLIYNERIRKKSKKNVKKAKKIQ